MMWLLVRPLPIPGVWDWQIIGVYDTQADCLQDQYEKFLQPKGSICAELKETKEQEGNE